MANLFKKAKENSAKKPAVKKNDKTVVIIEEVLTKKEAVIISDQIKRKAEIETILAGMNAELKTINGDLKAFGKQQFYSLYKESGRNPESFVIQSNDGSNFMFLPTDAYIKIDEQRAEYLKEAYGEGIVQSKDVFLLDNDMLEKHGETLSELIQNSKKIPAADKEKLIKCESVVTVAKGTIDKLADYGDIEMIAEEIQPIYQMKNAKVSID